MANESITGLRAMADLTTGSPTHKQMIARVRALIPDPDSRATSGAQAGGYGFLDQISPAAAAQIRVELIALEAAVANAA